MASETIPAPNALDETLVRLTDQHRSALTWFSDRAGMVVGYPAPLPDGTLLATRAKGIYKPKWTEYALSVRQVIGGPYEDKDPVVRPDGTWSYQYFQENANPGDRDSEFTNRALIKCWSDGVPVGVMRQTSGKPNVRYRVLGLAMVTGWSHGYFTLEGFSPTGTVRRESGAASTSSVSARSASTHAHDETLKDYSPEFAGSAVLTPPERSVQAEWVHGKVVDALPAAVAASGCVPKKSQLVDLALAGASGSMRVIFEVKTDADPYSIYTAIGQLMYHSANDPAIRMVIVLPPAPPTQAERIGLLGITVLTYDRRENDFVFDRNTLERVLAEGAGDVARRAIVGSA